MANTNIVQLVSVVELLCSYKVQQVEFGHSCDKSEEEVDNKSIHAFEAIGWHHYLITKLLSYALAQLNWCSYFI